MVPSGNDAIMMNFEEGKLSSELMFSRGTGGKTEPPRVVIVFSSLNTEFG